MLWNIDSANTADSALRPMPVPTKSRILLDNSQLDPPFYVERLNAEDTPLHTAIFINAQSVQAPAHLVVG